MTLEGLLLRNKTNSNIRCSEARALQICKGRIRWRTSRVGSFSGQPNLWAYTILRWLWSHLWPSCSLMKNSLAPYRGWRSLSANSPQPPTLPWRTMPCPSWGVYPEWINSGLPKAESGKMLVRVCVSSPPFSPTP